MSRSIGARRGTIGTIERTRGERPHAWRLLAVALGCLLIGGCAGQGGTASAPAPSAPTTSATYAPQLCSAAADYQQAANAVVHLDASKVGPTA